MAVLKLEIREATYATREVQGSKATHFYACTCSHWAVATSAAVALKKLASTLFKGEPMHYVMWHVPLEIAEGYDVLYYQPEVEGVVMVESGVIERT